MHLLTKKIANEIVQETSLRLQRNVNIMNKKGIIIAALDQSRIGMIHKGAVEVLATGIPLTVYADDIKKWEGTQPGVNLPIVFMGQRIGVIGVTGNPEDMGAIGELVKMTTELMIRQEFMDSQLEWKQRTKEMVIDQLLQSTPSVTSLNESLELLGIVLSPPFNTVIIQITERSTANRTLIQQVEEVIGKRNCIVGFINMNRLFIAVYGIDEKTLESKISEVYNLLKKLEVVFQIAYSLPFHQLNEFSKSYKECEITLEISGVGKDIVSFAQIEAKSLIHQVDRTVTNRFSRRVLKNFDKSKVETLESFFTNNLNIQKASDDLFLHRNTLIYRLNKITEDTGYDPRNFNDALILQVALWILQKEARNEKLS